MIFDEALRLWFLRTLVRISVAQEWRVIAYALMSTHYHLVLRVGETGLSNGMWQLNNGFARASNERFERINHCFGQRFWSRHLDSDDYLRTSIRYCMWNPPRAGVCNEPAESRWTSFRGSVGLDDPHPVLATNDLLALFDSDPSVARTAFFDYVQEGPVPCQAPLEAPWDGPPSR
jgi:putative transposase